MNPTNTETLDEDSNCRRVAERRSLSLKTIYKGIQSGNRINGRRASDRHGHYVDRFETSLLYVAIAILLLSGMDAMFTLKLMDLGAVEVNPFMAYLMEIDLGLFGAVKMAVTLFGLALLLIHIRFRVFRILHVTGVLYGILIAYFLLVAYELSLLTIYS